MNNYYITYTLESENSTSVYIQQRIHDRVREQQVYKRETIKNITYRLKLTNLTVVIQQNSKIGTSIEDKTVRNNSADNLE